MLILVLLIFFSAPCLWLYFGPNSGQPGAMLVIPGLAVAYLALYIIGKLILIALKNKGLHR